MDANVLLRALQQRYEKHYAFFPELRIGTGYGKDAEQRLDAWAIAMYPSLNLERITFEIKTSRQDFLNEIKNPIKRRIGLLLSNKFYFVTPEKLVKREEIPLECGLLEVSFAVSDVDYLRGYVANVLHAPWRESLRPNWKFIASLCRRIEKEERGDKDD